MESNGFISIDELYKNSRWGRERFAELELTFSDYIKTLEERRYYSASGRIELCGNHTDHQNGCVLAAAIEKDIIAVASRNDSRVIRVFSRRQRRFAVGLDGLAMMKCERGKSAGLVRGIAAKIVEMGGNVAGVDIALESAVATGSGISSSAAFEVIIATILNDMFNDNYFNSTEIAKIGQLAEREYFGKPCGLMDQMAVAYGGCVAIDFGNDEPSVKKVSLDCVTDKYDIMLVHPGGSHANLTKEYSSIVEEMNRVAGFFGKAKLIQVDHQQFMDSLGKIKQECGDRALTRAMHFFAENERVKRAVAALENNDSDSFISIINASGDSSALLLQNVYLDHVQNKSVALALALTKQFFGENSIKGACRIHGGGFVGTILAFVTKEHSAMYKEFIENVFGEGSVDTVRLRSVPGARINITE